MVRRQLIWALLLVTCQLLPAVGAELNGSVEGIYAKRTRGADTNTEGFISLPLRNAEVTLLFPSGTTRTTLTGSDGKFYFREIPESTGYEIRVSHGDSTTTYPIDVKSEGRQSVGRIYLKKTTAKGVDEYARKNELQSLIELWRAERYAEVLPRLIEHRKRPYGRNVQVDYMIATSACRVSGMDDLGAKLLQYILVAYSLEANARKLVSEELSHCQKRPEPIEIPFFEPVHPKEREGVRG